MKMLGAYEINKVICGDAKILSSELPDESVDLILTDPPFGIDFKYSNGYNDNPDEYIDLLKWLIKESDRIIKPGGLIFVFVAQLRLFEIMGLFPNNSRIFAACKNFVQMRNIPVQYAFEPVIFWQKEGPSLKAHKGRDWHVGNTANTNNRNFSEAKFHSCPRPLDTITYMIENFCPPTGIVLDFFMGSGTTAVGSKITGRSFFGFEIDQITQQKCVERIKNIPPPPYLSSMILSKRNFFYLMDLSIVSGTYNRLSFLQNMVRSARNSVKGLLGLQYEFCIVDGGSVDGTIEWAGLQPDINLIQHGELQGAIKAFNDGAYAASGKYVILGNDDIEFVADSIRLAFLFMEQMPDCGMGCFYQNRNGKDWHVDAMPTVRNGKQTFDYYGQVCIVRKWLGDEVGWWLREEDYLFRKLPILHTYGGDNELSSKIYEQGYKIIPIEGAKILDKEADDALRKINNISGGKDPRAVKGHHPDSWHWGKRWRNEAKNLVGAIVKDSPIIVSPDPETMKERILYLPIYEQGWEIQKEQKRGLKEALARAGLVWEYDYFTRFAQTGKRQILAELQEIFIKFHPTIFLGQLHNGDILDAKDIKAFKAVLPSCRFVNWNGDYWPDQLLDAKGLELANAFDLMLTVNRNVMESHQAKGINTHFWQIGWEPDGINQPPSQQHDIVFLASGYSKERQQLGRFLMDLPYNVGLFGSGWPEGASKGQCLYDFKTGSGIYRGAKISIGDSQWPQSGFVSNRVMQALAAGGAALAHQWFRGMEDLGLVDGETCIIWHNQADLKRKIDYYLSHEEDRKRVALKGESLALTQHSFDVRVEELWGMLGIDKEAAPEDHWRF